MSDLPPQDVAFPDTDTEKGPVGSRYSYFVLGVLMVVYVLNFLDRQILSILAEDIKGSLGLEDAQLGFLYGTAFAVFYAVFGIPLGRVADSWARTRLISWGIGFWSLMTALSGTARSFGSLATFRFGVGVGEASASPAAYSLLGDYFPPRMRATVLAFYSSGIYVGSGLGMAIGGLVLSRWNTAFTPDTAPFGLEGWQATFMIVGLPGLLLALLVATLREPVRGQREGIVAEDSGRGPLGTFLVELSSLIPLVALGSLLRAGAGRRGIMLNLVGAAALGLAAWGLTTAVGSPLQWVALGIGLYAGGSWSQGLALRDPVAFSLIFRTPSLVLGVLGFSFITFSAYGWGLWSAPFLVRVHGMELATVGMFLGLANVFGGFAGANLGGFWSDWLKRRTPKARCHMGVICAGLAAPAAVAILWAPTLTVALTTLAILNFVGVIWIGSGAAMVNELVLPRIRGTASAVYLMTLTFIGLALGPFVMGKASDLFSASGMTPEGSLKGGMLLGSAGYVVGVVLLWMAGRHVEKDEATLLERARALGEAL
jgi:MFS family permease